MIATLKNTPCLNFTGTSQYVKIPNSELWALGTHNLSFAFTIYNKIEAKTDVIFFAKGQDLITKFFRLGITNATTSNNQRLQLRIRDDATVGSKIYTSGYALPTNRYNNIVININRTGLMDIYVNDPYISVGARDISDSALVDLTSTLNANINTMINRDTSISSLLIAGFGFKKTLMSESERIAFMNNSYDNSKMNFEERFFFNETQGTNIYGQGGTIATISGLESTARDIKTNPLHGVLMCGFDKWKNNTDGTQLDVIKKFDGSSNKGSGDTITGYTHVSSNPAVQGHNMCASTQLDFTNNGANENIPSELNSWNPNKLTGLENKQLFTRKIYDTKTPPNKIAETEICIYENEIIGRNKAQTQIYLTT